jgi:hypothetical protein
MVRLNQRYMAVPYKREREMLAFLWSWKLTWPTSMLPSFLRLDQGV